MEKKKLPNPPKQKNKKTAKKTSETGFYATNKYKVVEKLYDTVPSKGEGVMKVFTKKLI